MPLAGLKGLDEFKSLSLLKLENLLLKSLSFFKTAPTLLAVFLAI